MHTTIDHSTRPQAKIKSYPKEDRSSRPQAETKMPSASRAQQHISRSTPWGSRDPPPRGNNSTTVHHAPHLKAYMFEQGGLKDRSSRPQVTKRSLIKTAGKIKALPRKRRPLLKTTDRNQSVVSQF